MTKIENSTVGTAAEKDTQDPQCRKNLMVRENITCYKCNAKGHYANDCNYSKNE